MIAAALARVVAALSDGEAGQIAGSDAESGQYRLGERVFGVVQRQLDVGQSKHRCIRHAVGQSPCSMSSEARAFYADDA